MDTTSAAVSTAWTSVSSFTTVPWVPESVLWILILSFIIAFLLSFAVGANDVANSFGTTVGAKVLTLRQACILASVFETAGAVLIGAKVGETIRKGIIDVNVYTGADGPRLLMLGSISAMFGSSVWQMIATGLKLPVSGTHSIVGACIGFSLVAVGSTGINWSNLGFIVASWFISPVLTGGMAVGLYYVIQRYIIHTNDPLKNGLRMLPGFYAVTLGVNIFSFFYSGAPLLGFDNFPAWAVALISLGGMVGIAAVVFLVAVPRLRTQAIIDRDSKDRSLPSDDESERDDLEKSTINRKSKKMLKAKVSEDNRKENVHIEKLRSTTSFSEEEEEEEEEEEKESFVVLPGCSKNETRQRESRSCKSLEVSSTTDEKLKDESAEEEEEEEVEDPREVRRIFSALQILTACLASFAHGGNDVCNAIGPLIAIWLIFWSGEVVQNSYTPWYLLLYGGFGVSVGLWVLGRRVIGTIGKDLTKVTPSRGFCIEVMTAITVLVASNVGIPVSTTHCKVGAVVAIGWYRSRAAVDWNIVRNIAFAWFVTVPVSGLFSAAAMYLLMLLP